MTAAAPAPPRRPDPLLELLAEVMAAVESPPAQLVDRAADLFALRLLNGELLELLSDSGLDAAAPAARADDVNFRVVLFQGAAGTVELEIDPGGETIIGRIEPAGAHAITVLGEHHELHLRADDLGRFALAWPPPPWLRLQVDLADGTRVVTPALAF